MTLPVGYAARPARVADVDAILALSHAVDTALVGAPDTPRDFVEMLFSSPFLDPGSDIWIVEDGSGAVVGCADLQSPNPEVSLEAFVRVHPAHTGRGLSTALLGIAEARARERAGTAEGVRFRAVAEPVDAPALALLASMGFERIRTFVHMERELGTLEGEVRPPEGVAFRGFRPEDRDEWATFHRVIEAAFADHFDAEHLELETFIEMWTGVPTWDPELVTFAEAGGEVVGAVVSNLTATEGLGWLSDVGVLEAWRGRGIATALLLRAFADLAARGCDRVRLNVDAENTTGATRLYERAGMHVHREWAIFDRALAPAD